MHWHHTAADTQQHTENSSWTTCVATSIMYPLRWNNGWRRPDKLWCLDVPVGPRDRLLMARSNGCNRFQEHTLDRCNCIFRLAKWTRWQRPRGWAGINTVHRYSCEYDYITTLERVRTIRIQWINQNLSFSPFVVPTSMNEPMWHHVFIWEDDMITVDHTNTFICSYVQWGTDQTCSKFLRINNDINKLIYYNYYPYIFRCNCKNPLLKKKVYHYRMKTALDYSIFIIPNDLGHLDDESTSSIMSSSKYRCWMLRQQLLWPLPRPWYYH